MSILVNVCSALSGEKLFNLEMHDTETVLRLKERIAHESGISVHCQKLLVDGNPLFDDDQHIQDAFQHKACEATGESVANVSFLKLTVADLGFGPIRGEDPWDIKFLMSLGIDVDVSRFLLPSGELFEIPKRFHALREIARGAYGVAYSAHLAYDESEVVAIKKIRCVFEHPSIAKRAIRELKLMRLLRHQNIVDVQEVYLTGTESVFEDIYVVMGLMESDLYSILASTQVLSDDHCRVFLYQILCGLLFVHSSGVVHRNVKPGNILVNSNGDLNISGFELARLQNVPGYTFHDLPMTEYVCTRWYRAPEVLCSWIDYGKEIDIWAVGCILGEMLQREVLFKGSCTQQQLELIIHCLGTPSCEWLQRVTQDKCRKFMQSLPLVEPKGLISQFTGSNLQAIDLLSKMLIYDPNDRFTAGLALEHVFLSEVRCTEAECIRKPLDFVRDFEFERRKINSEHMRREIFQEVLQYLPDPKCNPAIHPTIHHYRLLGRGEVQFDSSDED